MMLMRMSIMKKCFIGFIRTLCKSIIRKKIKLCICFWSLKLRKIPILICCNFLKMNSMRINRCLENFYYYILIKIRCSLCKLDRKLSNNLDMSLRLVGIFLCKKTRTHLNFFQVKLSIFYFKGSSGNM